MNQLRAVNLGDLVFIDIETVRNKKEIKEGGEEYEVWNHKYGRLVEKEGGTIEDYYIERSALYAEFAKIVCISVGTIKKGVLYITTYKDTNEAFLLQAFTEDLNKYTQKRPNTRLVGHGVKGFDIPFIFRRCLINCVRPSNLIDVAGLKPWEVTALDTKDLWKGSSYYNSSLLSVCYALGIPSPKQDISGAEVGDVYFSEGEEGLERISRYCEQDVLAVANFVKRCRFEEIFTDYEAAEPKEREELGLIDRIAKEGRISKADSIEILEKVKGAKIAEKEHLITVLKSALLMSEESLPQDLEIAILSAK